MHVYIFILLTPWNSTKKCQILKRLNRKHISSTLPCTRTLCSTSLAVKEELNSLKLTGSSTKTPRAEITGTSKLEGFSILSCGQVFMGESEKDEMLWLELDIRS